MKHPIIALFFLLAYENVSGQKPDTVYSGCSTVKKRIDQNIGQAKQQAIYNEVFDSCPEFKGGTLALEKHFSLSINAPDIKVKNIFITFIIEKDGHLSNGKIVRGVSTRYDNLSLQLVKTSPKWTPAVLRGKPVRMNYTIPVRLIKKT